MIVSAGTGGKTISFTVPVLVSVLRIIESNPEQGWSQLMLIQEMIWHLTSTAH